MLGLLAILVGAIGLKLSQQQQEQARRARQERLTAHLQQLRQTGVAGIRPLGIGYSPTPTPLTSSIAPTFTNPARQRHVATIGARRWGGAALLTQAGLGAAKKAISTAADITPALAMGTGLGGVSPATIRQAMTYAQTPMALPDPAQDRKTALRATLSADTTSPMGSAPNSVSALAKMYSGYLTRPLT